MVKVWRNKDVSHKEVVEEIKSAGFRLPTSDEWEYLCGGGVSTLYRWGKDNPSAHYRTDCRPGRYSDETEEKSEEFTLYWEPNQFMPEIASDSYECEIVSEGNIIRGGDSGSACCAGTECFLSWRSFSPAYFQESLEERDEGESVSFWKYRQVRDLGVEYHSFDRDRFL